jgi:hypothetical protein
MASAGIEARRVSENLALLSTGKCAMWIDATVAAGLLFNPDQSQVADADEEGREARGDRLGGVVPRLRCLEPSDRHPWWRTAAPAHLHPGGYRSIDSPGTSGIYHAAAVAVD